MRARRAARAVVLATGLLAALAWCRASAQEPSAPEGWWHSLVVDGSYCRLAAYPPKAAVGTSRVVCRSRKYDHNFLFRLAPAGSNLSRWRDNLTTDSNLQLRSFNLIATFTTLQPATKDVVTGVSWTKASAFTVEAHRASGDAEDVGSVSLQRDALRLAARQGGYCARAGGSAGWLRCGQGSWRAAGRVTLPYSSYWGVQLINQLTGVPCAAQLPSGGHPGAVVCSSTQAEDVGGTWLSTFGLALHTPGRPRLLSGNTTVAIKAYDAVFHYKVYTWVLGATTPFNATFQAGTQDPLQWLQVAKLSGRPGEEIKPGDVVTLRSAATKQFCGVWSRTQPRVVCDVLNVGLLGTGYQFKVTGAWLP